MGQRLTGLDAQRGIAAAIVVIYHLEIFFTSWAPPKGYLLVDFFFMLSGFVLERTYGQRMQNPFRFLWGRYRRFWPTMAVATIVGLGSWHLHPYPGVGPWQIAAAFAIVPMAAGWAFPLNGASWSLAMELLANFVHACRLPLGVTVAMCFFLNALVLFVHQPDLGTHTFFLGVPRALFAYLLGVWLYRRWGEDTPRVSVWTWGLFALLVFPWPAWFDLAFVALACPLLIASGATNPMHWGSLAGRVSFPLYALHIPVMRLYWVLTLP